MSLKNYIVIVLLIVLLPCAGCVTRSGELDYIITELPDSVRDGVYHKVNSGETLWRIAKTYGVTIREIIESNNIPNVAQIERDQLVFIPGVSMVKDVLKPADELDNEFVWPVKGKIIEYFNQSFQKRNDGIDIAVKEGTVVQAARMGHVVFADYLTGYGYMVVLDHKDGFYSVYAQNSELLTKLGSLVLKREEIARIGKNNHGCFLHFEIRKEDVADNPLYYLP